MRVDYSPLLVDDFIQLFDNSARGGALNPSEIFHSVVQRQKGSGFLSILGNWVTKSIPFLRRVIAPAVGSLVSNIAQDLSTADRPFRQSLKTHGIDTLKTVGSRLLSGTGRRRRRRGRISCTPSPVSIKRRRRPTRVKKTRTKRKRRTTVKKLKLSQLF